MIELQGSFISYITHYAMYLVKVDICINRISIKFKTSVLNEL